MFLEIMLADYRLRAWKAHPRRHRLTLGPDTCPPQPKRQWTKREIEGIKEFLRKNAPCSFNAIFPTERVRCPKHPKGAGQ